MSPFGEVPVDPLNQVASPVELLVSSIPVPGEKEKLFELPQPQPDMRPPLLEFAVSEESDNDQDSNPDQGTISHCRSMSGNSAVD